MRADLYTLALISALPEEHPLQLAQPNPGTITVNDQIYGIYTAAEPDVPVFDLPTPVAEGEEPEATLQSVIDAAAAELQSGTEMIVVNRALLTPLRDLLDPPPPEPVQYKTLFTSREFRAQIPEAVLDSIYERASTHIKVQQIKDDQLSGDIYIKHPAFIKGIGLYLQEGLFTPVLHDSLLRGVPLNLSIDNAQTADDWRELALSMLETPPAERMDLDIEVIKVIPDIDKLEAFVEGEGIGKVNRSYTLENARTMILNELGDG